MSLETCVRHNNTCPVSLSYSGSAKVEYFSSSMSPSIIRDLQLPHWPSLQPCIKEMPCRKAASNTVSPSSTSISTPNGSKRTVWTVGPDIFLGFQDFDGTREGKIGRCAGLVRRAAQAAP